MKTKTKKTTISSMETNEESSGAPRVPVHWEDFKPGDSLKQTKSYMQKHAYTPTVAGLDIETSESQGAAWLYLWCMAIDDHLVYGRTIQELKQFLRRLAQFADLRTDFRMVVYIHNAKYDLSFLKNDISLSGKKQKDFIARTKRQIIRCGLDYNFEMRDSAVYSEVPLRVMGHEIGLEKIEGYDYEAIRTPETPLSDQDLAYCARDAHILTVYYRLQAIKYGTIGAVPLTATGCVRRIIGECLTTHEKYNHAIRMMIQARQIKTQRADGRTPTPAEKCFFDREKMVLQRLRTAFFGGHVYMSELWANTLISPETLSGCAVKSADINAAYALMILTKKFPMEKFEPLPRPATAAEENDMRNGRGIYRGMALLIHVKIMDLHARVPDFGILPGWIRYSSSQKDLKTPQRNSRIVEAEEVEMILTDVDYRMLKRWYKCKVRVITVLGAAYGYLPTYIRDAAIRLYIDKAEAKKEIKQLRAEGAATLADEIRYNRKKTMLARMYGVFVEDPVKMIYEWDEDAHTVQAKGMQQMQTQQFSGVLYQWGVWVSALAREKLLGMCAKVGTVEEEDGRRIWDNSLIYDDTDCIRWISAPGDTKHRYMQEENERTRAAFRAMLTPEEIRRFREWYGVNLTPESLDDLGQWEIDTYKQYKQIGLKQYAYIDEYDQFHAVFAGLPRADVRADGKNYGMTYFDKFATNAEKMAAVNDSLYIPAEETHILRTSYFPRGAAPDVREVEVIDCTGTPRHVRTECGVLLTPTDYKARRDDPAEMWLDVDLDDVVLELAKAGIEYTPK